MFWIIRALFGIVSVLLAAFPGKVVSWHASQYQRNYTTEAELASLDKAQEINPFSRWIIGQISEYARQGPQALARFPCTVAFVRIVGLVLTLAMCAGVLLATVNR